MFLLELVHVEDVSRLGRLLPVSFSPAAPGPVQHVPAAHLLLIFPMFPSFRRALGEREVIPHHLRPAMNSPRRDVRQNHEGQKCPWNATQI